MRATSLLKKSMHSSSYRQSGTDIASLLTEPDAQQQSCMKKGILSIIDIILVLAKYGIPFRGNWDKKERAEDSNFAFFMN